jgi:hypothetical protein
MFSELAELARSTVSEFLSDAAATYQYRAAPTQSFTTLAGVVELSEVTELRKVHTGLTRVALIPIRVAADQFAKSPIVGGVVRITRGGTSTDYQIESISKKRSERFELKLQRTTVSQITRPGYRK